MRPKRAKGRSLEEIIEAFPELQELGVLIDGTERPIRRPKEPTKQKEDYSGKKKRHSKLTPAQKESNTELAKARISIEHSNAGLKRNRSVADILRNTRAGMSDQLMQVAMGLHNLRVTMRASYQHSET